MNLAAVTLAGTHVRLEPLARAHVPGLLAAAGTELELYKWSFIPQTLADATQYVANALAAQAEGTALPFATVRVSDGVVIGSTRFFDIERWGWPAGHEEAARPGPDTCEIGYTWLAPAAIRTAANTEAKLLMLTHAFDVWGVRSVSFHTDARNERSRAALTRLGAGFEGVLRAHRLGSDIKPRDSARFSIVAAEWPRVRERLRARLAAHAA
ncbi:MAG: GNAT family N-acetyltransferase [Gammaproteobacteria bacterium]|nr:GNAT family N-acetyltransferase [Gammaproteobacteria bacterium]